MRNIPPSDEDVDLSGEDEKVIWITTEGGETKVTRKGEEKTIKVIVINDDDKDEAPDPDKK